LTDTPTMSKEVMMSMRMAPEAGAAFTDHHAPQAPPVAATENNYSSNYKGVMLCDRPGIEVSRAAPDGGSAEPFLTAVNAPEQLGLNPIKKERPVNDSNATSKPKNPALSNHKRWLRSLGQLKKELAEEEELQREDEAAKKRQLAEDSQKVRDHIRQIKRGMAGIDDVQGPAAAAAILSKQNMLGELNSKLNRDIVEELHNRVPQAGDQNATRNSPAPAPKPPASAKPAWARTEEEEEENEEMEVEDLLAFAEDLDIDQYMDDCEFREALAAAKARIAELESEDEDDVGTQCTERSHGSAGSVYSTMSAALRAKEEKEAAGQQDWDGSVCSEKSKKSRVSRLSRAVAEELLEMNPNLRQKHSSRSLAEIVEKKTQGFDPNDHDKFGRCGMGAVKVAVHNEENRLHRHGEVTQGKDLPYLYRNPAV